MSSPIEDRLAAALDAVREDRNYQVQITSQARIAGYRVDFLVEVARTRLVVECDGHEWHERTQQQASYDRARDRALLKAGYVTVRFTGSDVHRDAEQCAIEVLDLASAMEARSSTEGEPDDNAEIERQERDELARARARASILDLLRRSPARNKTTLVAMIRGRRDLTGQMISDLHVEGMIERERGVLSLTSAGRAHVEAEYPSIWAFEPCVPEVAP